jgi:type II secretory pathway pseudopilin PulG
MRACARHSRRGFFWADVSLGLAVIAVVAVILVSAVGRQNKAAARLGDARAAARIAEDVLTGLQTGAGAPADAEANVRVVRSPAADVAPGKEWADVTVVYRGRPATLTGLVPAERRAK